MRKPFRLYNKYENYVIYATVQCNFIVNNTFLLLLQTRYIFITTNMCYIPLYNLPHSIHECTSFITVLKLDKVFKIKQIFV